MKRISHFTYDDIKNIAGKKFRKQRFGEVLIAIYFFIALLFVMGLVMRWGLDLTLTLCFSFMGLSLPVVILSILNKFCIGKVTCVLAEDRLFFFDSFWKIDQKNGYSNGYLLYSGIQNVKHMWSDRRMGSRIVISGENFQIFVPATSFRLKRALIKIIKNKPDDGKQSGEETVFICSDQDERLYTPLYKEVCQAYDNGSLLKIFDEKTVINYTEDQGGMITIVLRRNGYFVEFDIDMESVYLSSHYNNYTQADETRSFQPDTTLQDVCDWMTQFLIENTENAES